VPNFEELQSKIVEGYVLGCDKFWSKRGEYISDYTVKLERPFTKKEKLRTYKKPKSKL
jgi:hypothetical protein